MEANGVLGPLHGGLDHEPGGQDLLEHGGEDAPPDARLDEAHARGREVDVLRPQPRRLSARIQAAQLKCTPR